MNKVWRQVSQSAIVNCWRKADILDNKNIDYSIDLKNFYFYYYYYVLIYIIRRQIYSQVV